jgi:universal stress protein family protein
LIKHREKRAAPVNGRNAGGGERWKPHLPAFTGATKEVCMSLASPVLAIGLKRILVATDFSEFSEKPLHCGLKIARHYGAKLYLANVVSALGFTLAGTDWRDAGRLALAVRYLLQHPQDRQAMGDAGREFARNRFSQFRLADDLENLYLSPARSKGLLPINVNSLHQPEPTSRPLQLRQIPPFVLPAYFGSFAHLVYFPIR